jgi:hypothetical protein
MSAGGFRDIVTDGLVFQVDAANMLSFSDKSLDIVDSNIKLHWDFSKITGLNNLDNILAVPDQSGNGYTGTSVVGEEFVFLENYTDQNLSVGDDITSANGVQTSSYSADGILELLIMYSTFDYSNGNRFSMPTSISPLINGITINHTTATTFRSVNKWQGTATQESSTWTIPDQSIDSLHIYALKISVSNKLMELFVDGVSYGTKPIDASATSILATLGDTYLGHGQSGATGSGNINYGEMFVAEGVYSSSKIIEYSNRLTNKWGNFFTKNIVAPTQIGSFNNGASVVDNGYSFDGVDDYIDFGVQNYNIDKDETFSISVWFKQTNLSGRKDLFCDIAAVAPFKGWSLRFNRSLLNNNRYYLLLQVGVGNSIQGAIDFAISADTIYNMVFTYDGSSTLVGMLGYINGVNYSLTDTGNTISASISNSNKTTIGSTSPMGGTLLDFGGTVYSAKIYNRVLTPSEIKQNHNTLKYRFQ